MNTIIINDIKIEFTSDNAFYITKGDWVIYLDDSIEGEKIISHWIDIENNKSKLIAKLSEKTYRTSVIDY
jgi:hypothetical protein